MRQSISINEDGTILNSEIVRVARGVCADYWGTAQTQEKVRGMNMWLFTTAGHGGFVVAKYMDDNSIVIPDDYEPSKTATMPGGRKFAWYAFEEDCDYAIPLYFNPDKKEVMSTLGYPDAYLQKILTEKGQTKEEWLKAHWGYIVESIVAWAPRYIREEDRAIAEVMLAKSLQNDMDYYEKNPGQYKQDYIDQNIKDKKDKIANIGNYWKERKVA